MRIHSRVYISRVNYRPCGVKCRISYHDSVDHSSANDRVFYVYALGSFHNTPVYVYGETDDITSIEFELKKTVPMYQRIVYQPAYETRGLAKLDFNDNVVMLRNVPLLDDRLNAVTAETRADILEWVDSFQRSRVDS